MLNHQRIPVTTRSRAMCAVGFTLTEILIALAIVMILAAISFTVFARVRENARSAVCQNNLKQIALAVQQYTSDNDGRFPDDFWQFQLRPYAKVSSYLQCPTNKAQLPASLSAQLPSPLFPLSVGYIYNGGQLSAAQYAGRFFRRYGKHESAVLKPSQVWINTDDQPTIDGGLGGVAGSQDCEEVRRSLRFGFLHNSGANYSFVDGHVKWLKLGKIADISCSSEAAS
jgi:prepilin-type processing-associated H-X9-DG protein